MKRAHVEETTEGRPMRVRGGTSASAILTGVVVAIGAFFLLTVLIGGVLTAMDVTPQNGLVEAGIGVGIAMVVAQLISYFWGGYTAGRMGRGAGVVNGLLVPVVALLVAAVVAGIAWALGAAANVNLPFTVTRIPVEENVLVEWGAVIGGASLIAMFLGGILGGMLGARWHSRLENVAFDEREERLERERRDRLAEDREYRDEVLQEDEEERAHRDTAAAAERARTEGDVAADRARADERSMAAEEPPPPGETEPAGGTYGGSDRPSETTRRADRTGREADQPTQGGDTI